MSLHIFMVLLSILRIGSHGFFCAKIIRNFGIKRIATNAISNSNSIGTKGNDEVANTREPKSKSNRLLNRERQLAAQRNSEVKSVASTASKSRKDRTSNAISTTGTVPITTSPTSSSFRSRTQQRQDSNNPTNFDSESITTSTMSRGRSSSMSRRKAAPSTISSRTSDIATTTGSSISGDGVEVNDVEVKNRPFTLPPGLFRPKQSLGQNFLSDQNYVEKIVNTLVDHSEGGHKVIEIGPGAGALTRVLYKKYPQMTAIEIDQRAVKFLSEKLPGLKCLHMNVLSTNWAELATERGGRLNILGNLPYYITSQVLFSLADHHQAIQQAVVTMQLEVAERITAKPKTKDYGIPSVVFQLYGHPKMEFKIPPSVFYPQPKVDSALLTLDFTQPHPELYRVKKDKLRRILTFSFQQRRKMLRVSLKDMLLVDNITLLEKWSTKRPEELTPSDFLQLTTELYGPENIENNNSGSSATIFQSGQPVWRVALAEEDDDGVVTKKKKQDYEE